MHFIHARSSHATLPIVFHDSAAFRGFMEVIGPLTEPTALVGTLTCIPCRHSFASGFAF
jgi:hypothetical protein